MKTHFQLPRVRLISPGRPEFSNLQIIHGYHQLAQVDLGLVYRPLVNPKLRYYDYSYKQNYGLKKNVELTLLLLTALNKGTRRG